MFSFYLYFEESEKNPQKNGVQSKHIFIMKKSQELQLLLFEQMKSLFDALDRTDRTLDDEFWYEYSSSHEIAVGIPEPSSIEELHTSIVCDKYIFCFHEPVYPVFWIFARTCIEDRTSMDKKEKSEETKQIHLQELFSRKIIHIHIREWLPGEKFLDNIGSIFFFIFF